MANEKIVNRENLKAFRQELDNRYAKPNGNYPTMTVGVADQLSPYDDESGDDQDTPFSFQATGTGNGTQPDFATGSIALMKEKQGNTVVVNQQINYLGHETNTINDVTFTNNNNGTFSLSGTASATAGFELISTSGQLFPIGHKILILGQTGDSDCYIQGYSNATGVGVFCNYNTHIFTMQDTQGNYTYLRIRVSSGKNTNGIKIDVRCVDLTQWFNGDIPQDLLDHPENFFRYYQGSLAYNTGELVNANGRYIKCIGRQQWDEEWELGDINENTGENISDSTHIRSKNYIRVIPNTTYLHYNGSSVVGGSVGYFYFYDKDKNYIGWTNYVGTGQTLTTPSNCCYIRFNTAAAYGTTYNHDITISIYYEDESGYDQYYPYEVLTNNDTGTEVLRSAGSVRDYKTPDGTIHRLVGSVDLGTLSWALYDSDGVWYSNVLSNCKTVSSQGDEANVSSNKYTKASRTDIYNKDGLNTIGIDTEGKVVVYNGDSSNSPTGTLYYELATPTTEQGTPYSENLVIDDFGSMDFQGTNGVPQGNLIFYPVDYKAFIDTLYDYTEGTPSNIALKSDLAVVDNKHDALYAIMQENIGGALRHQLADKANIDFANTDWLDLGTLACQYGDASTGFLLGPNGTIKPESANMLTAKYEAVADWGSYYGNNGKMYKSTNGYLYINDTNFTDATTFKNSLKGVLLAYEKASS